jgi:hypothetical protein
LSVILRHEGSMLRIFRNLDSSPQEYFHSSLRFERGACVRMTESETIQMQLTTIYGQ